MKYLFFDIECSNCFNNIGKMCEFGYVLTDEKFNVIKKDDIPMSPGKGRENRFHLTGRKNQADLSLSYDNEYYLNQPEFPNFYNYIKSLVEDSDTICFAYLMDNDIPHLFNSCKRYGKKPFDYVCYDIQKLAARYLEMKGQIGLHNACLQIVGPSSTIKLQEHLSRDDAQMEKMIFEAICTLTNKTSVELLNESEFARTNSNEYMSRVSNKEKRKRIKTKGHALYSSLSINKNDIDKPEYIGKRYNFSGKLKSHYSELENAINKVKNLGGVLVNNISKSDFFIVYDEDNKKEIIKEFKRPFEGKFLTYQELIKQ